MKRILRLALEGLAGVALAGVLLALLLPLLVRSGYLAVGSPAGLWIIGGVITLCVILVAVKPWGSRRGS
jgi:hypothetical protein